MEQRPAPPPPPPPSSPVSPTSYRSANIVDRIKNILITPKPEWDLIDKERTPVATVWASYVLPLLLIGAFATFIGFGLIGYNGLKWGAGQGLLRGLIYVIFMTVVIFGVGAAIDVLGPSFGSERNWGKSYKLAAYSMTAAYLAGIFWFFPALWILVLICSLYSLYALYIGIAGIKKTTADKQVAYFAVVVLITVILYILLQLLFAEIIKAFQPRPVNPFQNLLG